MKINGLDHLVLTVHDLERSIGFYTQVLGMTLSCFAEGRKALHFGNQKINLHEAGSEYEPKADKPLPGSADLCFLLSGALEDAVRHIELCGLQLEEGPVSRTGAQGPIRSVYLRDPDGNLIELAEREESYLSL